MKNYKIVNESNGKVEQTSFTSTRKRDILKSFNRFVLGLNRLADYSITMIREGYAKYTYFGEYGTIEGEYYIICD